jgi:alkylhydroperoxidase family enzyme
MGPFVLGVDVARIRALEDWQRTDCFDRAERAVLRLADEVCGGTGASEGCIQDLKAAGFDDEQTVELVLTASFYACVARVLVSMAVDLESAYERYLDGGACRLPAGFTGDQPTH